MGASLAEELGNALDGVELPAGDDSIPGGEELAGESTIEGGDTGRDEHGRFKPKEAREPAEPEVNPDGEGDPAKAAQEQQTEEQRAESRTVAAPPATWSASAKAIYGQLPEVARKEIAKREQDYARGIQQYAEKAKYADAFQREAQPYEAMLRAEGSDPVGALKSFLHQAYVLRTAPPQQKAELIMQVAQQYGADLSPYFGQKAEQPEGQTQDLSQMQQFVQQLVAPHLQKIQQWEQQQSQAQREQEQQMEQGITSQIAEFQNATNEDGSPKHLYFENVRGLMSAYFASGQAKDLDHAYEMACWANPEVRAALQADQQRSAEAKRLDEAKRKAREARNSGFNVSGQGGVGISGATQSSLRDELETQLDAAMGGARV